MRIATTSGLATLLLATLACSATTVTNSTGPGASGKSSHETGGSDSRTAQGGAANHTGGSAASGASAMGGSAALGGEASIGGESGTLIGGNASIGGAGGNAPSNGGAPIGGDTTGGTQSTGGTQPTGGVGQGGTQPTGGVGQGGTGQAGTTQAGIAGGRSGAAGSSTGGVSPRGGAGGTGGQAGSGCTGAFERVVSNLCVTRTATVGTAGATFEIDVTEVTRGQYAQWLSTSPLPGGSTDAYCNYKTSTSTFAPDATCISASTSYYQGANSDHHPVVCVDWCDAFYYCRAVSKRLCGKIGGGPLPFTSTNSASESQWYSACSSNGQFTFTYGSTYAAQRCNGADYTPSTSTHTTLAVGSLSDCHTPTSSAYAGVYDLSGNAAEWVNACDNVADPASLCQRHGGSFRALATDPTGSTGTLDCNAAGGQYARSEVTDGLGFRCCSSP